MKKAYLFTGAALVACAAPNAAYAQDGAKAPQDSARSEISGTMDIVVTAQRRSERLQDVPMAITAIRSENGHRRHRF